MTKLPTILLALTALTPTEAQPALDTYAIDWELTSEVAILFGEMAQAYARGDLPELAFTPDELETLFRRTESALRGKDLSDLENLKPAIPDLLVALYATESGAAYADWLLQRYDYIIVAGWARAQIPEKRIQNPDTKSPPPPTTTETTRERTNYITNLEVWKHRIGKRPVPQAATSYVPTLKPIFRAAGVPEQLVWLAEVESSFNPEARSPVGAVGLFQFMPKTGEWMGLALNPEDERTDPEKSARAAARYLTYLHGQFNDWPLALAAYNYGQGNIRRLLKELNAKTFNEIVPRLPTETQMYVPKIYATIELRDGPIAF